MMRLGWAIGAGFVLLGAATPALAQRVRAAMGPAPIGSPASWINADDYPADAIRSGRQGRVVARLDVDATGHVIACRIATSSGTDSLDAKTCEILLERGTFNPATDRRGRAIASVYNLPVRWVLPDASNPDARRIVDIAAADSDIEIEYLIGVDSKVVRCRVINKVLPNSGGGFDPCQSLRPGTQLGESFTKDGKPVAVTIRQRFTRTAKVAPTP